MRYRSRVVLGLTPMASQAFFYNAIFFTYALMLTRFYGIAEERVGYYIFPFALGNFLGPLLLGRLFDGVGRRADGGVVDDLLRRLRRGELRLPDRERSISARDARRVDLAVLRRRHRAHRLEARRRCRAPAARGGLPPPRDGSLKQGRTLRFPRIF